MERLRHLHRGFYTVGGGGVITDDFSSQSAGTQLTADPNWELLYDPAGTPGVIEYVTGARVESITVPSGDGRRLVAHTTSLNVNHYVEATYYADIGYCWVFGRGDSSGNCYYAFYGGNFAGLYRLDTGTFTTLGSSTPTTVDGAVVRLEANGSTIRMLVDTGAGLTELFSVTDTNHSTQTRVGVGISTTTGGQLDDFEAGNL